MKLKIKKITVWKNKEGIKIKFFDGNEINIHNEELVQLLSGSPFLAYREAE